MLGIKLFKPSSEIQYLDPNYLKSHVENHDIYNQDTDESLASLMADIEACGIRQPIFVLPDGTILSGDRRRSCALKLGLDEVPCVVLDEMPEDEQRIALVSFNNHRVKTPLEIYREGQAIEKSIKRGQGKKSKVVAGKLGNISPRQYERIKEVVEKAPTHIVKAIDEGRMSVSAVHDDIRHLEQQDPEIKDRAKSLLDNGNEKDIKTAVRQARRMIVAERKPVVLPPEEEQSADVESVTKHSGMLVFYPYDLPEIKAKTQWDSVQSVNNNLAGIVNGYPVKDHLEDHGLLFLWTFARTLPFALNLLKNWGFTYLTSVNLVWANNHFLENGFIPENASMILIAKKDGSATPKVRKNEIKGNSLKTQSRNGTLEFTPASLVDYVMSFGDGPYLQLWGPQLPERCDDEGWRLLRP